MNRFVIALAVTLVLGIADVSQSQYGFGTYTAGHARGSYGISGCCTICSGSGPFGNVALSFPPGPGSSTLWLPGLIPPTPIVASPPSPSPPPTTEKQPAPSAAASSAPTTPPLSPTSAERGSSRVMSRQTSLN
jgi:hypothetical protein